MNSQSIMWVIGPLVFTSLCVKYRNNPNEYLAIIRYDREGLDNGGFSPHEYGLILRNKEEEDSFLRGLETEEKPWSKYL